MLLIHRIIPKLHNLMMSKLHCGRGVDSFLKPGGAGNSAKVIICPPGLNRVK